MANALIRDIIPALRRDLEATLALGAARTPLDPPDGGRWVAGWVALCLAVGLTLLLAGGYHAGFMTLNTAGRAYPDWLLEWVTSIGGEGVPFVLGLLVARRYPRLFWALVLAAILASAYSRGLKPLFDSARPPAVLPADSFHLVGPEHRRSSFPSGHSVAAGVLFGVLVYYARWWEVRVLSILAAVLVGLSRVAVGVHWPVDVAFGLAGGAAAAWLGARLAARWPAGATSARLHLVLVAICSIVAATLILGDPAYPLAGPLLRVLGGVALGYVLLEYLFGPLLRLRNTGTDHPRS
jgi:membrane-associated phospholipid phosphatase